jgi:proline iminopeptidase
MRRWHPSYAVVLAVAALTAACSRQPAFDPIAAGLSEAGGVPRETILDRVVSTTPHLVTEIPQLDRWCDLLPGVERQRVGVGDAELYVEVEGKGVPLVLINGGPGGTHHYFHPWFSTAAMFARVIYYDQRGCGLSDSEPGRDGYSVEQAVADLDAIRRALNIDKWVLLGYSYGGLLAQYYAVSYPEAVRGLVLLSASPGMWADTGASRQQEFISDEERDRMTEARTELRSFAKENNLPRDRIVQLSLYNNFLNGDWKRQHFYKPSPDRLARIALYEWVNDQDFNSRLNQSASRIDLSGVFARSPFPTLILEGKWDLTWGEKKRKLLADNHPKAQTVLFEHSAHAIYDEEPEAFFAAVESFIRQLPRTMDESGISAFREDVTGWRKSLEARPQHIVAGVGWGLEGSRRIVAAYQHEWLDMATDAKDASLFLRLGFAHYDLEHYDAALQVFERMEEVMGGQDRFEALALIWQGHMLDLMGNRRAAIDSYRKAAAFDLDMEWTHSQYGLSYRMGPYARERQKTPFKRVENIAN